MPAGTSLGHGIGLQTPRRLDSVWLQRLANENRVDELQARQDEQDLIKAIDIDVDFGKYYPPYAKAIQDVYSKAMNDIVRYRQANDGRMSPYVAKERMLKARQEASTYEMANANAKRYVEGQGFLKNENLVRDITSAGSTVKDLGKHNQGQFIQVGDNGEFAFLAVPDKDIPVKYDDKADRIGKRTGKVQRVGNKEYHEVSNETQPEAIEREALSLYQNPAFRQQELFRAGQQVMKQAGEDDKVFNARVTKYLMDKATEKAKSQAPLSYISEIDATPYHPPQGSGSDKKINNLPMNQNVKANIATYKTEKGKDGEVEEVKTYGTQTFPFSKPVKVTNSITIPANSEMFSAEDNRPIEGSYNIVFNPNNIVPVKLKKDGTHKSYVIGKVDKNVDMTGYTADEKRQIEKLLNIYVPLEMVQGQIKAENDISDYEQSFTDLTSGGEKSITPQDWNKKWSALKSGESLVGLDGKTYTKK